MIECFLMCSTRIRNGSNSTMCLRLFPRCQSRGWHLTKKLQIGFLHRIELPIELPHCVLYSDKTLVIKGFPIERKPIPFR